MTDSNAIQMAKINEAIKELTPDFIPIVQNIENGLKTTQNNYGPYMELITRFAANNEVMQYVVSKALIAAGANVHGVKSALRIVHG